MRPVSIWTGVSTGYEETADREVVTTSWSVKEGVEILDAQVVEGTMLILRCRVPEAVREDQP